MKKLFLIGSLFSFMAVTAEQNKYPILMVDTNRCLKECNEGKLLDERLSQADSQLKKTIADIESQFEPFEENAHIIINKVNNAHWVHQKEIESIKIKRKALNGKFYKTAESIRKKRGALCVIDKGYSPAIILPRMNTFGLASEYIYQKFINNNEAYANHTEVNITDDVIMDMNTKG